MTTTPSTVLSLRPIDALEATLIETWQEVSKATHRFLMLLREFDLRQGPSPEAMDAREAAGYEASDASVPRR